MIPFFADFYVRQGLPQLIGCIATELRCSAAEQALLLGSFFPGYVAAQIPSGILARLHGPKLIITLNLVGNALLCLLLPLAARTHKAVGALAACLCAIGLFQAPMVPAISALYGAWMPKQERAFALAIPELGSKIAMVFSPLTVPVLANRFGWRAVALTYGAGCGLLGTLWHACAADAPSEWRQVEAGRSAALISLPPMNAAERRLFAPGGDGGSEGKKAGGLIPRYLLRAPAAYAPVLAHICDCLTVYSLMQWGPTIYLEKFNCTTAQTGAYIAVPNLMHWCGQFFSAALEKLAERRGVDPLTIRRGCVFGGATLKSCCLLGFAFSRTPSMATIFFTLNNLVSSVHLSGFVQSYLEVGGADVSALMATGNTFANLTGVAIPPLGVLCRNRFGAHAWTRPFFAGVGAFHMVCATMFCLLASTQSAASLCAEKALKAGLAETRSRIASSKCSKAAKSRVKRSPS